MSVPAHPAHPQTIAAKPRRLVLRTSMRKVIEFWSPRVAALNRARIDEPTAFLAQTQNVMAINELIEAHQKAVTALRAAARPKEVSPENFTKERFGREFGKFEKAAEAHLEEDVRLKLIVIPFGSIAHRGDLGPADFAMLHACGLVSGMIEGNDQYDDVEVVDGDARQSGPVLEVVSGRENEPGRLQREGE